MRKLANVLAALPGRPGGCKWTSARLLPYHVCDPSLTERETRLVAAHLVRCRACGELYTRLGAAHEAVADFLYPRESLPHIDAAVVARAIVAGAVPVQRLERPAAVNRPAKGLRLRWAACAAAAFLLVGALPVLAAFGPNPWRALTSRPAPAQRPSAYAETGAGPSPDTSCDRKLRAVLPACPETNPLDALNLEGSMSETTALAEIEAGLPQGDAEYEAWARKEYPHVMALYDILIGKPANAWPGLPEEVRDCLARLAKKARAQEKPLWDGRPVNTPAWAARLYAGRPECEGLTGWKALLVYSGEAFELDWPPDSRAPLVVPTLEGLCRAALVAGQTTEPLSALEPARRSDMPGRYLDALANDGFLAERVIDYVTVSSRTVGAPSFDTLADAAAETLAALHNRRSFPCLANTRLQALSSLFAVREECLDSMGWEATSVNTPTTPFCRIKGERR